MAKKLVSATFTPVTRTRKETVEAIGTARAGKDGEENEGEYPEYLVRVSCIWYPITFRKKFVLVLVLIDLDSEVNAIHSTFARQLDLPIRLINVRA